MVHLLIVAVGFGYGILPAVVKKGDVGTSEPGTTAELLPHDVGLVRADMKLRGSVPAQLLFVGVGALFVWVLLEAPAWLMQYGWNFWSVLK